MRGHFAVAMGFLNVRINEFAFRARGLLPLLPLRRGERALPEASAISLSTSAFVPILHLESQA